VQKWCAEDVREWLTEVAVDRYKPLLVLGMTGPKLLQMDHKNELKVSNVTSKQTSNIRETQLNLEQVAKLGHTPNPSFSCHG
jgi:hypothetical protein